uniref:Uncharacterized protein n=1 Tax=Arundo donax TaxID=35708 RepID=A0A0A9H8J4_ARUDO
MCYYHREFCKECIEIEIVVCFF